MSKAATQKKYPKYVFKTDNHLMQVNKLPPVFKTFVLSIFEILSGPLRQVLL